MKKVITIRFNQELVDSGNDFYLRLTPKVVRAQFTRLPASDIKGIINEIKEEFRRKGRLRQYRE